MSNEMVSSKYPPKQVEQHRTINVDYDDWSEFVQDEFQNRMDDIGINVDQIHYSGFWSQGDGACFSGSVRDWEKYLAHLGYDDPILLAEAKSHWVLSWKQSGFYCHHKSVVYHDEIYIGDNPYDEEEDTLRYDAWDAVIQQYDLLKLTEQMKEDIQEHAQELYRDLETEYNNRTSDEAVIQAMIFMEIEPETD